MPDFAAGLLHPRSNIIWTYDAQYNNNPPLSAIRGKIVFLQDLSNHNVHGRYGIFYNSSIFSIQDKYGLVSNWDLYTKWTNVKNQLSLAARMTTNTKIYINYLSGSGGAFPYFGACDHGQSGV